MTRILLYTAKGGVGKTSIAGATDVPLAPEPIPIAPNLDGHVRDNRDRMASPREPE